MFWFGCVLEKFCSIYSFGCSLGVILGCLFERCFYNWFESVCEEVFPDYFLGLTRLDWDHLLNFWFCLGNEFCAANVFVQLRLDLDLHAILRLSWLGKVGCGSKSVFDTPSVARALFFFIFPFTEPVCFQKSILVPVLDP